MRRISDRLTRIALLVISIFLLVSLIILTDFSWQYAFAFTHRGCGGTYESLASKGFPSDPITIATPELYQLHGWFTRGDRFPEDVIIVLPGGTGNTQLALENAFLLARHGYSTFVFGHRVCSDTTQLHSGGYLEAGDLVIAVQYLKTKPCIQNIAVLGFSTGGSAALLGAASEPDIQAVVAEGGFSSLRNDTLWSESTFDPIDWLIRRLVLLFIGVQLGLHPGEISPVAHIADISPRPVFLIYGEFEEEHGNALFETTGEPKQIWIVPGVGHGGYQDAFPQEYTTRILGFFDGVFNNRK